MVRVGQATDDNVIWHMGFACWTTKAIYTHTHTHTHTECVTLTAFPLQLCLQERASVLRGK